MRRLVATEAARGSYDAATEAVCSRIGNTVAKRQVECHAARSAADFEAFYAGGDRPCDEPVAFAELMEVSP